MDGIEATLLGLAKPSSVDRSHTAWLPEAKLLGFAKPSSVASKNHEATLLGFAMPDSVASRCRTVWLREAKQCSFANRSIAAALLYYYYYYFH